MSTTVEPGGLGPQDAAATPHEPAGEHPGQSTEHAVDAGHGAHPSDAQYVIIALILAAVTAVEVGLYYLKMNQKVTNTFLIVLAAIKFVIVAAYFMHLKFDNKLLRRVFITGMVLAGFCYFAYLQTLHAFF